ncbi:MAG: ABC transporter ATP-binding protein [Verrucomicrobiae bacterium]|nr:ABC transporter ATP-binding protein [Verrucomicrobiae bacterium]
MIADSYVDFSRLNKTFQTPKGPLCVVRDFDLKIRQGQFVTLIGHSGCGKSTVLSMLAGLQEVSEGVIVMAGKEVTDAGPDRGVVFQAPCLLPWFSALKNVTLGLDQVYPKKTDAEKTALAVHYLELVGLGDDMDKMPSELSQGMKQRVSIARAFALNPKMLLLDEPFGMLDGITRIQLQQELVRLWESDQKTVLMVTHDVDEAVFLSDRVVMMTNGPEATVGKVLTVDLPRPRNREAVLDDPAFYALRGELLEFLESPRVHDPVEIGVPVPPLCPEGSPNLNHIEINT